MGTGILVVASHDDPLGEAIGNIFRSKHIPVHSVEPSGLAGLSLELRDDALTAEGTPIAGVLFRTGPNGPFSLDFDEQDRSFCDAEVRALWLAAMHLPSLLVVNRFDAEVWFEQARWSSWRRRLVGDEISVAPLAFGDRRNGADHWLPYGALTTRKAPGKATARMLGSALASLATSRHTLVVRGRILEGEETPGVLRVADRLAHHGILIARIATDEQDRFMTVDTCPAIPPEAVPRAADLLAEAFDDHLHRR